MPPFPSKRVPPRGPGKVSARQRVLAQWRGVDVKPLETGLAMRAQSPGSIIPKVLAEFKIEGRRMDVEVVKVWNNLIDPAIVAHAQPARLHKGTLYVDVDSSVWLSEIVRYRRKEILERLQHSFGPETIKKISYRVG